MSVEGDFQTEILILGWISPRQAYTPGTNILHRSNLSHLGVTALNDWTILINKSGALPKAEITLLTLETAHSHPEAVDYIAQSLLKHMVAVKCTLRLKTAYRNTRDDFNSDAWCDVMESNDAVSCWLFKDFMDMCALTFNVLFNIKYW